MGIGSALGVALSFDSKVYHTRFLIAIWPASERNPARMGDNPAQEDRMGDSMPTIEQARRWYPPNDPVHGFDHVMRVYRTATYLAEKMGADLEIVQAAALLHDAHGAVPHARGGGRESHELSSAEFARRTLAREGWPEARIEAVEHCIRAHRFRGKEAPATLEARVVFEADKLDVLGAFGIARTVAYAVQANQPTYHPPSQRFLNEGRREADEPHSAYHEYLFKLRHIAGLLETEPARELARERALLLDQFFQALEREASWSSGSD